MLTCIVGSMIGYWGWQTAGWYCDDIQCKIIISGILDKSIYVMGYLLDSLDAVLYYTEMVVGMSKSQNSNYTQINF